MPALLLLLETDLEFSGLGFDHFQPTDKRMVVTRAVPEERLVLEINGSPAAEEYARLVKVPVGELSPMVFAAESVLVRNGISITCGDPADSRRARAHLLSAIDDGLLFASAAARNHPNARGRAGVSGHDGEAPDFILGFDCYLRKLEIERQRSGQRGFRAVAAAPGRRLQHLWRTASRRAVNQTFVGVAFFRPKAGSAAMIDPNEPYELQIAQAGKDHRGAGQPAERRPRSRGSAIRC